MSDERKVSPDALVAYNLAMALDQALGHLFRLIEFHDADSRAFSLAIEEARQFLDEFEQVEVH